MRRLKKLLLLSVFAAALLLSAGTFQAAENMVARAKANKLSSGEFQKSSKGLRFRGQDGKYLKDVWCAIGGKIYYFDPSGYAGSGWFRYQNKRYYAGADGAVYAAKWLTKGSKRYYLKKNGVRAEAEWVKKGGKYYYFDPAGLLVTSKQIQTGGKYYYVDKEGVRRTNCWLTMKNKRYFFGKDGVRYQSKWIKYNGKYYYLQKNGVMASEAWVGDYYVGADGARMTDCVVDSYYLDAQGKRTKILKFSGDYLIVGDSRVVGMEMAVSTNKAKFIGKVSMGYSWLNSYAGPLVRCYLAGNPKLKVVFAFGLNDLANIERYISYYRSLMKDFPNANIYFLSVNPVAEATAAAAGYTVKNSQVKPFNAALKKAFGSQYLNCYSYLIKHGFSATDGIHYTAGTYQKIYDYIAKKI